MRRLQLLPTGVFVFHVRTALQGNRFYTRCFLGVTAKILYSLQNTRPRSMESRGSVRLLTNDRVCKVLSSILSKTLAGVTIARFHTTEELSRDESHT